MHYYAIIVAGGQGSRMDSAVPKQFLLLGGMPVLMHSIRSFRLSEMQPEIIVVLPFGFHAEWMALCSKHNFDIPHRLAEGGATRYHSVKSGLKEVHEKDAVVAVHDAARPLVSSELIDNGYRMAAQKGNAVVAVKSRDSIRQLSESGSRVLDREQIYLVQTPQTFRSDLLAAAYELDYKASFTDDASVAEHSGVAIHLIEGSPRNIKITFPEDIVIAEALLRR